VPSKDQAHLINLGKVAGSTNLSGTNLNSRRLAPKGRAPWMGRIILPPLPTYLVVTTYVDQDGDEIDILVQKRRNKRAASRFFRKLLKEQQATPLKIVTGKLRSYSAAKREIMPSVEQLTEQYENNRCELSHQSTRQQERKVRRFKSPGQAQRFLSCHGVVNNLYRLGRHLISARNYRVFRDRAFTEWNRGRLCTGFGIE